MYTMDRVYWFMVNIDSECSFCALSEETHEHMFFQCSFSRELLDRMMKVVEYHVDADSLSEWYAIFAAAKKHNRLFELRATALGVTSYSI